MSEKESSLKPSRGSSVRTHGALGGKCQRVAVVPESAVDLVEADICPTTQRKTSSNEVLDLINDESTKVTTSQKTKKPDLSKYMDDNLRNFDLLVKRKERSSTCSSGDNTSHSTGSKSEKEKKITESSLSAAAKEHTIKAPANVANAVNVDTPSKRGKSKAAASKFSIDAVDSPKGKVPNVSTVSSSLASAIARSAMARTKTTGASVEIPGPVVVNDRSASAIANSTNATVASVLNTSVELNGSTAENQHTSTSTNTRALTLAFKSNPAEIATNPVAAGSDPAAPASNTVIDSLDASKPKRVSFIAPQVQVRVDSTAPAPSEPQQQQASVTPKHSNRTSHTHTSSSQRSTNSSVDPSSSGSRDAALHRSQSQQSAAIAPAAHPSGGILSDPARFVEVNGRQYIRLNVLGKGGSSCVYRIIGVDDGQIYAYKRVEVRDSEDSEAVFDSYANEIALLRRLSMTHQASPDNPHDGQPNATPASAPSQSRIIELIDSEVRRDRNYISMILEAGDIALAKVLTQKNSRSVSSSGVVSGITGTDAEKSPQALLDPFFARMVWREMLEAVDHIHQHRIVHGDLKPANFVFVKGHLKLIDFGIAKSFSSDTTNIYRESQIGTINYMAPEAIAPMTPEETDAHPHHNHNDNDRLKMRLGRASDIWSLGCILYQMVYGRPPFAALNTIQKLSVIPNPKHVIKYADWGDADAVDSMKACLQHDARLRSKIKGPGGLLELPYLQVPHNTLETSVKTNVLAESSAQQIGAIGKEQVHCIVGAVLDSLHGVAQQAVEKIQSTSVRGTRTTRSGRGNAEVEAAQKLAQGIVQWIDQVDQGAVENEVMEVVQEQNWPVPSLPMVTSGDAVIAKGAEKVEMKTSAPAAPASTAANANAATVVASPGSPYVAPKRKIGDITPGSVTRSASKTKRAVKDSGDLVPAAEPSVAESARKVQIKGLKDIKDALRIPSYVPSSSANVASKTPSQSSPRANTVRPAFLHTLGARIPAFPALHSAVPGGAIQSTSNNSVSNSSSSGNSCTSANTKRSPLKAMPLSLQQQILNSVALRNRQHSENDGKGHQKEQPEVDRAAKWMRPLQEENSVRSAMEKRLSAMRQFLSPDQDEPTSTETGFYF